MEKRSLLKLIGLVFIFVFSFSLPIWISRVIAWSSKETVEQDISGQVSFPGAPLLNNKGESIEIPTDPLLEPVAEKDFLFLLWVNFRELPKTGSKQVFISKYNNQLGNRAGYAIAVSREKDILQPVVYWVDGHGRGAWYPFAETTIFPGKWYLLALSYYGQQTLALHIIDPEQENSVDKGRLGGHLLEKDQRPVNKSPLQIGAFHEARFEGRVGDLGIFQSSKLGDALVPFLSNYLEAVKTRTSIRQNDKKNTVNMEGQASWLEELMKRESVSDVEMLFYTEDWKKDFGKNKLPIELKLKR